MTRLVLLFVFITGVCSAQSDVPGDYPEASTEELHERYLRNLGSDQLLIMRNEVFARYGHIFKNKELREHFTALAWYKPKSADVTAQLTELEKSNVQLILVVEAWLKPIPWRKLPTLSLPFNMELGASNDYSEVVGIAPGFQNKRPAAIVGLLPDTSRYYAVVWYSEELAIIPDSPPLVYYVTTYNKKLNQIASAVISMPVGSSVEVGGTDCDNTNYAHGSAIGTDLSYFSEYSFDSKCPGEESQSYDFEIAGQIKSDGTIVVTKDKPYK